MTRSLSPGDLAPRLSEALGTGGLGLRLDLQPICSASTLEPVGYEALLRWDLADLGTIHAADTFAAAEEAARGPALEAWALMAAFRLRAAWPANGPYLAVNLSAASLARGQAAPMVRAALEVTGADPRGLSLELPEAAVMRDIPVARALAAALRDLGITVALDDFGGSHGSARVLRDIPFAVVKLDPGLTEGVEGSGAAADRARTLVGSVVEMAHALGAVTVAEAVETVGRMQALQEARCDALQGWLLGRPGAGGADQPQIR